MRWAVVLLVGLFALTGCPQEQKAPPPPPPPPPAAASQPAKAPPPATTATSAGVPKPATGDVAAGKQLFLTACANCHGVDGTGSLMRKMMPKIGNLTSPELHKRMKDEDIANLIKNGRDKMPAFGTMLPPDKVAKLIAYLRTLEKKQ